jgi:hypothetical protein
MKKDTSLWLPTLTPVRFSKGSKAWCGAVVTADIFTRALKHRTNARRAHIRKRILSFWTKTTNNSTKSERGIKWQKD